MNKYEIDADYTIRSAGFNPIFRYLYSPTQCWLIDETPVGLRLRSAQLHGNDARGLQQPGPPARMSWPWERFQSPDS